MFPFPEALGQKRGDALGGVSVCVLVGQLRELQALGPQRIIARGELLENETDRPETIPGSYQTLEEAVKACEAGEVAPDETIYISQLSPAALKKRAERLEF